MWRVGPGSTHFPRVGRKACPGLQSGINSATGRRHQPPSPEQRQPRESQEKCSAAGLSPVGLVPQPWNCMWRVGPGSTHFPRVGPGKHVSDLIQSGMDSGTPHATPRNHRCPNNDSRGSKERCTAGAYPQPMARRAACLGCTDRHPANFIFPMRPSQGHGDSREGLESTNFIHADKRQTRINALPLLGYASRE